MTDEGVHEIQLNGKQLVFLFMAATVVAVVIFLSGVMVGRGVAPARIAAAADATETPIDPTSVVQAPVAAAPLTERRPVSAQEDLTYAERLEGSAPARETLKPSTVERVAERSSPVREAATPVAEPAAESVVEAVSAIPPGNGWVVQVGAYPRSTAESIARGLAAKGFPTFIQPRERGLFAVRVGKYTDRREADAVKVRLERDEQFKTPWVTR
jgi:cell division protein FtsN